MAPETTLNRTPEATFDCASEATLERVLCIQYPVRFRKDQNDTRALIDSGSEVNAKTPVYASKLDLSIGKTDVCRSPKDRWINSGGFRDGHSRLLDPGQAGKGSIIARDLVGGDQRGSSPGDAFPHRQQCRPTVL